MSRLIASVAAFATALLLLLAPAAHAHQRDPRHGSSIHHKLFTVSLPHTTAGAIRLRVTVRKRLRSATVVVNGHRVAVALRRHPRQRTIATLETTRRVRFGRNVVVVRGTGAGGARQVVRRVVRVRRSTPLVGLRKPAQARQGEAVRLDGRHARAAAGGKLEYRWRIASGPRGASGRLTGADTPTPRLVAGQAGRYQVALTVSEPRRGSGKRASASAAAACLSPAASASTPADSVTPVATPLAGPLLPLTTPAGAVASTPLEQLSAPATALEAIRPSASRNPPAPVATTPPPPVAARGCTTQFLTVDVVPATGPMGVAFDSRAVVGGKVGVRVGASFYPVPQNVNAEVIYLDAATLEPLATVIVPDGANAEAYATAEGLVYAANRDVLMIIAYPRGDTLVKGVFESDETAISNEGFQLGNGTGAPGPRGELTGWLQPSAVETGVPSYRLVLPDRVPIETQSATDGKSNTIAVGAARYTSTLPAGASAGFQVLVLDPALRPQLGTPAVFGTNSGNASVDGQAQSALASLLKRGAAQTADTVVVQSIGRPKPTSAASVAASQQIERLGGTEWLFLGLNGSGGYALIGNTPPLGFARNSTPSPEASSQWTGGADELHGLLERRNDSAFQAVLADSVLPSVGADGVPSSPPDYSFQQVLFQPFTAWPVTVTDRARAAATYIAKTIGVQAQGPGLCSPTPAPDVRAEYCNAAYDTVTLANNVRGVSYPSGGTSAFSAEELAAVQSELLSEISDVATVRSTIATAQTSLLAVMSSTGVDANAIAARLIGSIPVDGPDAVSGNLGLASAVLYVSAELPEVGPALGFAASVLDLASVLTEDDGVPSPDWTIQTTASDAGEQIQNRLTRAFASLGSYGDILVSDYGKLTAAVSDAAGPWGVNANTAQAQIGGMKLGVKQWLYSAILPAAYDLVRIPGADPATAPKSVTCVYSKAPATFAPWGKADPRTMFFPLNDWGANGPRADQMMAMLNGSTAKKGSKSVPRDAPLGDDLFDSPADGGAGLVAPWLYDHAGWRVQKPRIITGSDPLNPGSCDIGGF
ncbi:MAG TPA: hypothetical protein VGM91_10160 [Conexibacter sp.]